MDFQRRLSDIVKTIAYLHASPIRAFYFYETLGISFCVKTTAYLLADLVGSFVTAKTIKPKREEVLKTG